MAGHGGVIEQNGQVNQREAESELEGEELLAAVEGSLPYVKELWANCLEADLPASIGRPPGKGGKS